MKIYACVDMTRADAKGSAPVYILVKNARGRFLVNTGLRSCGRLVGGRVFPSCDRQGGRKTTLLGRYLADAEEVCLQQELLGADNKALKSAIQREVFGMKPTERAKTLPDYIMSFASTKRASTATLYGITARKVESFAAECAGVPVDMEKIDGEWLDRFRSWCMSHGMKVNGAGKELRNIRAVFNWCLRNGYTKSYPFLGYSIVEEETLPNNLCVEDLRRLRDWPCEEWQRKYVDFFMLSFYMAGMNPVDLLLLRKDAVRDGHVSFVRRKTNKQGAKKIRTIVLPLVDEARSIIERYPSSEGYLLGFMDGRADYHSFMKKCNEALKKVGPRDVVPDKVGRLRKIVYKPLFPDITLYAARYSFGSIAANDLDISEQTIGQCLGHSWSKHVTARYIAHDQRKVDNAVRRVVAYVEQDG